MGPQRPSSTHSFLSSSSSIAPSEQAAAGFAHTVSTCRWLAGWLATLEGVPAVGLNLGVVILLRSLIPLSLGVISCYFFGAGFSRKDLSDGRGLFQGSERMLPLHCRHPGAIEVGTILALQSCCWWCQNAGLDSPIISSDGTLFLTRWPLSGFLYRFRRILPFGAGVAATETGPHTHSYTAMRNRPRTGQDENKGKKAQRNDFLLLLLLPHHDSNDQT